MPKVTVKERIQKRMGKPFREIILENIPLGTGRYEAARILEDLCEKHREPDEPKIKVLHSTLWYTIKRSIESGELCEVENDPSSPPLFHFNCGKSKHVTHRKHTGKPDEILCSWTCGECGHEWQETKKTRTPEMMAVRSKSCPKCQEHGVSTFGKILLEFEYEGQKVMKAVVEIDGKPRESFVDSMMNPCPSPFEKETIPC